MRSPEYNLIEKINQSDWKNVLQHSDDDQYSLRAFTFIDSHSNVGMKYKGDKSIIHHAELISASSWRNQWLQGHDILVTESYAFVDTDGRYDMFLNVFEFIPAL